MTNHYQRAHQSAYPLIGCDTELYETELGMTIRDVIATRVLGVLSAEFVGTDKIHLERAREVSMNAVILTDQFIEILNAEPEEQTRNG